MIDRFTFISLVLTPGTIRHWLPTSFKAIRSGKMAAIILAKNAYAESLISKAGKIRRTAEKAIEAATSPDEVQAALTSARDMENAAIAEAQGM